MPSQRILLVIQNDESDPPHLAGKWLEEIGYELRVIRAFAGEPIPQQIDDEITALMPLGGHMGAMDDHVAPWLADERELLADAIARDIPILGICLGAQLLGIAGGGVVTRAARGEIGIYRIEPTLDAANDPVFDIPFGTSAAQWHEDEVSTLPPNATRLAQSENCNNQIFKIGRAIYGVQFHPEADLSIVAGWESEPDNAFTTVGKKTVLPEVDAAQAELALFWKPVIQRWGELASNVRGTN